MEESQMKKSEKWKKVLLIIALILQILQIVVTILLTVFQKNVLIGIGSKNNNEFIMPFNAVYNAVLSSVIFFICCFLLIGKDKGNKTTTKEIVTIILCIPIYFILSMMLNIFLNKSYADNYIAKIYSTEKYALIVALERYIALVQKPLTYGSLITMAVTAAISIGKKKK